MKKCISAIAATIVILSACFIMPINAEEKVDFTNKICTVETKDGEYLIYSGEDRGKALTVGDEAKEWRFKGFFGNEFAFIGDSDFAADVNGASTKEGVTIIQWTFTGANNQRWILKEAEDGYYYIQSAFSGLYLTENEGVVTQEAKNEELNQLWKINVTGQYESVVEKMLESEAAKSLSEYKYKRLYDFIMSGGEFNLLTYDKVEKMINERDYFNLSMEEQKAFVEECFAVEPTGLMYGSMATKLTPEVRVEYVGIREGAWQSWHGIPENEARVYNVTITDTDTKDTHTFEYFSPYDNDEEYALEVGKAVGCFEMPVRRVLKGFYYTSMNTSSWNGGDGNIWNNTGYRGDVNNMVQMFAHELGHVIDNGRQDNDVWYRAIKQDMVPVTGYGKTNRWEDLAEFSRLYLLAKGDEDRIAAIENTYPARTKAYKGLLYALDSEFYAEYKDEYEETAYAAGDYDKSVCVMISIGGKYMRDVSGEIVFTDFDKPAKNWYTWEVYTKSVGKSVVRNKATGRYFTFDDGALKLGGAAEIGLKSAEGGYMIIESSTGFAVDENCLVVPEGGAVFAVEETESIPFAGDYKIKLNATGEYLGFTDGEGITMEKESVWTFVPVDKDYYLIMDRETGKVFDISGNSTSEGASAILYNVTGGTNQHFKIVSNGDGTYMLEARHSGLKLTKEAEGLCQSGGKTGYVRWNLEKAD